MENTTPNHEEDANKPVHPIEHNYEAHKEDPGPAPTVEEPDNKGAGQAMKWIIPILILALVVMYFVFFRDGIAK